MRLIVGVSGFGAPQLGYTGMAIVPCSMTTLGSIASGVSGNLLARAAVVCLNERRQWCWSPARRR